MSSALSIRPLERSDGPALRYGFRTLGERSRYQRFLAYTPRLSDAQVRLLTSVDHWHHEALIAWASSPRRPVGVARYVRAGDFDLAEVAVAVSDDWQSRGVGAALMAGLARAAWDAGIRRFSGVVLAGNDGALRLARRTGRTHVRNHGRGTLELAIELSRHGARARDRLDPPAHDSLRVDAE